MWKLILSKIPLGPFSKKWSHLHSYADWAYFSDMFGILDYGEQQEEEEKKNNTITVEVLWSITSEYPKVIWNLPHRNMCYFTAGLWVKTIRESLIYIFINDCVATTNFSWRFNVIKWVEQIENTLQLTQYARTHI